SLGFGVIGGIITFLIILFYSVIAEGELYKSDSIHIEALKDNSNINGRSSFLGAGYINEEQYYFYIKVTDKGKKMSKVSVDRAYLNEGNYNPHIEVYGEKYKSDFAKWLFGAIKDSTVEYIIYVPENTITTEFNVDME
ncbi:hypothetical protein D7X33_23815, partial [Butyricicoccus sp. 1XD8-22]